MASGEGVIQATLVIPLNASVSDSCRIPRNSGTVTFFQPSAMAVPAGPYTTEEYAMWTVQLRLPVANQSSADEVTWTDTTYVTPDSPQLVRYLRFPFAANTSLSFPTWMLGGGQMRISTGSIVQPAAVTFVVYFSEFHN